MYNLPIKQNKSRLKSKFKIGDFIRISKDRTVFEKGYLPSYSSEIFRIDKIQRTSPVTYIIKDLNGEQILGAFYDAEMVKSKHPHDYLVEKIIKTKGSKLLVKWLGFKDPTWINKSDIITK